MNCINKWKREQWIDAIVFSAGLVLYTWVMFLLFYRQVHGTEQLYHSDMKAYILEMLGQNTKYSFPYPVFFKLGALFHLIIDSPELCIALAATILNSLSAVVLKYYMNKGLVSVGAGETGAGYVWRAILVTAAVFSVFFLSMLYLPGAHVLPGIRFKYLGVFTPNPFHNATYLAARPFAVVSFFLFSHILTRYEKETDWKENILFGLFLLLATMTKPSFTFVLVPCAGLIMLYRLMRSGFKTFRQTVCLGVCFIPTFIALLYQFFGVFGPAEGAERGVGFGIMEVWSQYSSNLVFSVLLGAACPLLILVLHLKEIKKNSVLLFAWQLYLVSLAEAAVLYEKGFRKNDFNFSWGYMYGLLFVFIAGLYVLLRDSFGEKKKKWLLVLQWLAYGAHVMCGIWYFLGIFQGNMYY